MVLRCHTNQITPQLTGQGCFNPKTVSRFTKLLLQINKQPPINKQLRTSLSTVVSKSTPTLHPSKAILTTYSLKSLPKKIAGPAKSFGSPVLPSGILPSVYFLLTSSLKSSSFNCVLIVPGSSALHRIPYLPNAHAQLCIKLKTPAFVGV